MILPKRQFFTLTSIFSLAIITGCSMDRAALEKFNASFEAGDYQAVAASTAKKTKGEDPDEALLWRLQQGYLQWLLQEHTASVATFDSCEKAFKAIDLQNLAFSSGHAATGMLTNDSFTPYEGEEYDRVLVNTYKALNLAAEKQYDGARVEFNRAMERQRLAKEHFAQEIKKVDKNLQQDQTRREVESTMESDKMKRILNERYSNLDSFRAYPDFANPFTTYAAGLYFLLANDPAKATDLLKEAYGMNPTNDVVKRDFYDADNGNVPNQQVWVVFENGLAPIRKEVRFDLPIVLPDHSIIYIGGALPDLQRRQLAYAFLTVSTSTNSVRTDMVCDMDGVVATEFRKDFKLAVIREVARIVLKTGAQIAVHREYGPLSGMAMGILQATTTGADTRSWSALPKQVQIARLDIPADRHLSLKAPNAPDLTVTVPPCDNAILYVRIPKAGAPPLHQFITFGNNESIPQTTN